MVKKIYNSTTLPRNRFKRTQAISLRGALGQMSRVTATNAYSHEENILFEESIAMSIEL